MNRYNFMKGYPKPEWVEPLRFLIGDRVKPNMSHPNNMGIELRETLRGIVIDIRSAEVFQIHWDSYSLDPGICLWNVEELSYE